MIDRKRLVLIGHPVAHSLSPIMHNAALDAAGISLRYEALDVEPQQLSETLGKLSSVHGAGNITIPHKRSAIGLMGAISAAAAAAGTVNTFWSDEDGHLAGDNTDVAGFEFLTTETTGAIPGNCRIAVLGAGGAAAAVLAAVSGWKGCTATVHSRSIESAAALCRRFSAFSRAMEMSDDQVRQADIVVNATPVGLGDDSQPVSVNRIAPHAAVIDLAYGKSETAWVRAARDQGHRASDGLPMLVRQGSLAFHRWFGVDPDEEAMWAAVLKATGRTRRVGGAQVHH